MDICSWHKTIREHTKGGVGNWVWWEPLSEIRQEATLIVDVQPLFHFYKEKNDKNQPSWVSFSGANRTEQQWHTAKYKGRVYKWTRWFSSHLIELLSFEEFLFVDYKENVITLGIPREFHNEPYLHCVDTNSNYNHNLQPPMCEAGLLKLQHRPEIHLKTCF